MPRRPPTGGEQPDQEMIDYIDRNIELTDYAIANGKVLRVRPGYREHMDPAGLPALLDAIRDMHGVESTWLESVPVHETFRGETVWQGVVQVFAVEHPQASRVYAWSHLVGEGPKRTFYAVLGAGPVVDAVSAVRVAIAADG